MISSSAGVGLRGVLARSLQGTDENEIKYGAETEDMEEMENREDIERGDQAKGCRAGVCPDPVARHSLITPRITLAMPTTPRIH